MKDPVTWNSRKGTVLEALNCFETRELCHTVAGRVA